MAGHLGDSTIVAAVGLGNMYINVFYLAIVIGMNGTISTFVSQAYGAGQLRMCGIYLNRGRIVIACFIPLFVVLSCLAGKIFVLIQQDPDASNLA
jgi:MATE family multidrug resistance protein